MSIEKEVEKMYREDAEKQKKNQKKKKSGRAATIIVLILIVILALLLAKLLGLFDGSGFGFGGKGKETEDGSGTPDRAVVVSAEEDESSEAEVKKVYDNIKVSGSTYLYKGSEVSLEDIKDTFSMEKMNKEVVALIEDDNATQNTMEDLTNALTEMGREYTIENATGTESETESAAQ
ncbi:hypothetical protein [Ruminococcus albus]|jgi:hypothetical protein|uniref:Uncharacterized protein n=1 Tax=Ruminococcus albus SY3 TaxID=1341156 RepID=A0A011V2V9_RUMAL|nr:hypothetical protein [Ruminococcus albus]EXM38248.1 hypothetical protein RASY3_18730 [Ruminococcus albus SY3]EXM39782.1 hypothetical protein RASY3_08345 [Ruminococcus albus SY3]MBE6868845.1 hypothetical protein [Ruminococcus albus]MBP5269166.1 hypothetical protein [Ruminococcus sp.]